MLEGTPRAALAAAEAALAGLALTQPDGSVATEMGRICWEARMEAGRR
jgi:hypothetical protein